MMIKDLTQIFPRLTSFGLCISIFLGQLGCASSPISPSEDIRVQFGTIGVVTSHFDPETALQTLPKGTLAAAWRGAGKGVVRVAGIARAGGGAEVGAVILGLMLALLPPSALIGAVEGAMHAEPTESVTQKETALREALAHLTITMHKTLQNHFLRETRARTNYKLVLLEESTVSREEDTIYSQSRTAQPIDTILNLSVESVELTGGIMNYPDFALSITAHVKVMRADDLTVLYDAIFPYEIAGDYPLHEWTDDNAHLFAKKWQYGIKYLASWIAKELFTRYRFP